MEKTVIDKVIGWCLQTQAVSKCWVFGSRAKGTAKPSSDLDLAIQIEGAYGEANFHWIKNGSNWNEELSALTGTSFPIHLEAAFEDDKVVMPAVRDHGLLIFNRQGTQ